MALWKVLEKELWKELGTELEKELVLSTFWTSLSMPHRRCLLLEAPVPVWVHATAPLKALFASPVQVDKSTSACRSQSQRLAGRPTLDVLIVGLAPSALLFDARVFSDRSRADAVFSLLSLYPRFSWWSITGKHRLRR